MRVFSSGVVAVVATLASAGAATGQVSLYSEGATLEFKSDLPWAQLALVGKERVEGPSPLRVPGPVSGQYWLLASGRGVEDQRGRVRVRLGEEGPRIASYGRPSGIETLLRATLYPGHAQYRSLDKTKGLVMMGVATASLTFTAIAQKELWDAESNRDRAQREFDEAGTVEEKRRRQQELSDAIEDVAFAGQRRDLFLGATAVCWGVSYLDALLFRPGFSVRAASPESITLGMKPKRRLDAALRSVVFPGLGQLYNGETRKAQWMATAGIAAGGWFLYRQDRYHQAVRDLNKIDARIAATTSVPERQELESRRAAQFAEVDDRWQDRNVAVALMAGVWGVAVVDAVYAHGKEWGGSTVRGGRNELGLRADPLRGTLAARVRF